METIMAKGVDIKKYKDTKFDPYYKSIFGFDKKVPDFYDESSGHYVLLDWIFSQIGTEEKKQALMIDHLSSHTALIASRYMQTTKTELANDKRPFIARNKNIKCLNEDILVHSPTLLEHHQILLLQATSIIYIDVMDLNYGNIIHKFIETVSAIGFVGHIIIHTTHLKSACRNRYWWNIPAKYKYTVGDDSDCDGIFDIIHVTGHDNNNNAVILSPKWTFVTSFFTSTQSKIKSLDDIRAVLSIPSNLVVFCDAKTQPDIMKIRPKYLHAYTIMILCDDNPENILFPDKRPTTTFASYRQTIIDNRRKNPYNFDSRNDADYYLSKMAKYQFMSKMVTTTNHFNSDMFAWIDIVIEKKEDQSKLHKLCSTLLREGEDDYDVSNKFSLLAIDHIASSYFSGSGSLKEYFTYGRCSVSSAFFTASKFNMFQICDRIIDRFLFYLDQGYGHSDEQLFPSVIYENPELFDLYYGDYSQQFTNYFGLYENPHFIMNVYIKHAYKHKDYTACYDACRWYWRSYGNKLFTLTPLNEEFYSIYMNCMLQVGDY